MYENNRDRVFVAGVSVALILLAWFVAERLLGGTAFNSALAVCLWVLFALGSLAFANTMLSYTKPKATTDEKIVAVIYILFFIKGVDQEHLKAKGLVIPHTIDVSKLPNARLLVRSVPAKGQCRNVRLLLESCLNANGTLFDTDKINENIDSLVHEYTSEQIARLSRLTRETYKWSQT